MYYRKNEVGSLLDWSEAKYSDDCSFTDKAIITAWNGLTYLSGEEPEKPNEMIEAEMMAQAKAERAKAVDRLTVEVEGMVFDADEVSQQRVARSIVALQEGETMPWVLYDNTIVQVNKSQLMQVLRLAGQKQCELWVKPYEAS